MSSSFDSTEIEIRLDEKNQILKEKIQELLSTKSGNTLWLRSRVKRKIHLFD